MNIIKSTSIEHIILTWGCIGRIILVVVVNLHEPCSVSEADDPEDREHRKQQKTSPQGNTNYQIDSVATATATGGAGYFTISAWDWGWVWSGARGTGRWWLN